MAKKKSAFNKVIGYNAIVIELKQLVDQIKNSEKYEALGAKIPKNLLIEGDPGLGKTLLATCVIEDADIPAFTVRKSQADMCDKIQEAFEAAAACEKAIVFLDDMDKFSNSDARGRHSNTDEYICIQSLIDEYRDSNIFVIATVNEPRRLPRSLVRAQRFDIRICCPMPEINDRTKIVAAFLKGKNCAKNVDAKRITRILGNHSVATLETVINQAAILAAYAGKDEIDGDDIIKAALKVLYNVSDSEEIPNSIAMMRVAAHQAAHLVVSEVLSPGSCELISLSSIGGKVAFEVSKEEDYWADVEYMKNRVTMLLAGKAGVEIVHGVPSTNSSSDIQRAFDIAKRFSEYYCCYGFEAYTSGGYESEFKLRTIERKTAEVISRCYEEAKKILINNRDFLEAAMERLISDNVLTSFEIEEIKAGLKKPAKKKIS